MKYPRAIYCPNNHTCISFMLQQLLSNLINQHLKQAILFGTSNRLAITHSYQEVLSLQLVKCLVFLFHDSIFFFFCIFQPPSNKQFFQHLKQVPLFFWGKPKTNNCREKPAITDDKITQPGKGFSDQDDYVVLSPTIQILLLLLEG